MSSDSDVVKDLLTRNLLGVFSEHDNDKRRLLIAKIWDKNGVFNDPESRWVGHAGINDAAEQLQRKFPDFAFSVLGDVVAYSGVGRLAWGFDPPNEPRKITGIDVLTASDDNRIVSLYTFVDPVKG